MQLQALWARLRVPRWIWTILLMVTAAWILAGGVADQLAARATRALGVPAVPKASARKYTVQKAESRKEYDAVASRNLFRLDVYVAPPPPKPVTNDVDENNLVESKLPALLVGTLAGAEKTSLCLIQDTRNRSVDVYAVGDDLFGMAKIFRIERQRVIVTRNGKQEVLILPEDTVRKGRGRGRVVPGRVAPAVVNQPKLTVRKEDNGHFVLDKDEFGNMLGDLGPLLSSARVVPNFEKGKINGYKIFAIKPGSIYEKIGIRNGDVIDSINGLRIETPDKALMMFQQLRSEDHFELAIRRGGEPQLFTYDLE